MSSVNSDNFLAVALVINRSRDGPAFVFHYPEQVQPTSNATEQPDPNEMEDILLERLSQPADRDGVAGTDSDDLPPRYWKHDEHIMTDSGSQIVPWEHVAGFPARDLASILTPARAYHKTQFQLSLDPLYCVSYPVHVPENGKWKKAKKVDKDGGSSKAGNERTAPQEPESASSKPEEAPKDKDGKNARDESDEEKRSSMTMFNLVFILQPRKHDIKGLVDTLYSNIVKKANKAYMYSQQHSDFVWKESKRILAAKEKAREEQKKMSVLWKEILHSSSLAASMHDIYEAVSQNRIAALHLDTADGVLTPSFQIPIPFYVPDIPQDTDQDQRGLWLTSANAFLSQDAIEEPGFLDRNFALLLMDDEKKIISELQADPDMTTVSMVEFVRLSKPTMSFYQVAQSNVLTLNQVREYAQHFIFWRRAIAIPPLHARDVYIVSPNCDPRRLPQDSIEWQRLFPVAPPLPNFLSELSQSPRPYKHFSPSKAHRPSFLLMLAWLMRRGWVTQLCTFAYVIVWPEIIYEVDYEMEAEELAAAREKAASEAAEHEDPSHHQRRHSKDQVPATPLSAEPVSEASSPTTATDSQPPTTAEHAAEMARLERIAAKAHHEATEKAIAHGRKFVPIATAHPSLNDALHLKGITPHIILDAKKATGLESRYLSAISSRFKDEKLKGAWQTFCRYFDGRCALERIALQEDMKRKEAWNQLTAMTEYILCTRHW
ncbi:unnamed protein product [Clonostachys rhizophaga]|uniref:Nitrogen permease regulator 3 n=1 Tax=Clonostachys rhizophaga TaxID=160324 RepID=A0A9N9YJB4_9HYPO|nr:unnamed protein product [Clonostachys rhizophaga]